MARQLKKFPPFAAAAVALIFAVTASSGPAAAADDLKSWQQEIVQVVAEKQVYPRSALSREIEGRAKVKLTVARDGTVKAHEIVERTGHDILDKEISSLVERIDPLPEPPSSLSKKDLSFILPLAWTIQ